MAVKGGKGKTSSAKIASKAKSMVGFKLATSYECENCPNQCEKGKRYIEQVHIAKHGKGVVCPLK